MTEFIGETHLSVSMGASEAMRSFCVNLMRLLWTKEMHILESIFVQIFGLRDLMPENYRTRLWPLETELCVSRTKLAEV